MPMSLPFNQSRESSRHPSLDRLNRLIDLKNDSQTTARYEVPVYSFDDSGENRYWGIADRDVPILIGAAAGAVGLVFLILGAVLIWYCCQFAFKSDKDMYSLDYESDRASDSSEGTLQPFSDAVLFTGRRNNRINSTGDYIKRSQSAPLNVNKLGLGKRNAPTLPMNKCRGMSQDARKVIRGQSAITPGGIFTSSPINCNSSSFDRRLILGHSTFTHPDIPSDYGSGSDLTNNSSFRSGTGGTGTNHNSTRYKSYLFTPASNTISQTVDNKTFQLHSGSSFNRYINHSSPCRSIDEEEEADIMLATGNGDTSNDTIHDTSVISVTITDSSSRDVMTEVMSPLSTGIKVNFSKKRRNRMLDDSAAAIAVNRTSIGSSSSDKINTLSPSDDVYDTDTVCLVENESVVVYKERTDL